MKFLISLYQYYKKIEKQEDLRIGLYESAMSSEGPYQIKVVFKKQKICVSIVQGSEVSAIFFCAIATTAADSSHSGRYLWREVKLSSRTPIEYIPGVANLIKRYVENIEKFQNNSMPCSAKECMNIVMK